MSQGWLSDRRVLDLTDHRGALAGALFARLGADVVQVEPPQGSSARRLGPFYKDASLAWECFGAGKRSVVCDVAAAEGKAELEKLAAGADVVIESGPDGLMTKAGLAWPWLSNVNPRGIHATVSAFGSVGPKTHYAESDLIIWAAGGPLFGNRDADNIPLRISAPQSYLQAAVDTVGGVLLAIMSGEGQHVDISAQVCVAATTLSSILASTVNDQNFSVSAIPLKKKALDLSGSGARTRRSKWKLRDGYVEVHLAMGPAGWSTNNLLQWMKDLGRLPDSPAARCDWRELPSLIEAGKIDQDSDVDVVREAVGEFLATMTKQEVLEAGLARRITIAPIMTTADLLASPHHQQRGVLETVETNIGRLTRPGRFAQFGGLRDIGAAPALGKGEKFAWPARLTSVAPKSQNLPCAGLKVLDFSWVVAGPLIGRALADFGATVVRVESSSRLDAARVMGPYPNGERDIQKSLLYENMNAGKLGLTLNLATPEGQQVARDLARWADVVIESFAPGMMKRWGLDYATLSAERPDLIMVSTSLMGQDGPYAAAAGFGNIGSALSGFQFMVGQRGAQPTGPFGPYTDYVGPKFGLISLLSTLLHRRTSGQGCHIDLAQVEATLQFLAPQIAYTSLTGVPVEPDGNRDPQMAPHGVFRCREEDSWAAIAVRDDAEWARLGQLVGDDRKFATLSARKANEDELERLIAAWTATRTASDVERELQALGIPAHVVAASGDFCSDPQITAVGHLRSIAHSMTGDVTIEGPRYRLSETPAQIQLGAPYLGRDNRAVLREFAGYDDAAIDKLEEAGILK